MPGVLPDILATLGNTPLVRLNRVVGELPAAVLAKLEYFNPGGSVKDRIGITIIEAAERDGRLRPGGTVVESTSGNTGVGLAIAAALRGYHTIFVLPDKMSEEKIRLLRAYGARVVITPTDVEPDDPRSYYQVARRLAEETPNAILADQYHNPANPASHYAATGPEIWAQTGGRVTHFVCCMGTGGTISGVGRALKERNPHVQIVGVDPVGSILHDYFYTGVMTPAHSYKVEGFGEDFIPTTTDFGVIDDVIQVTDNESFAMTRQLVYQEGIFSGGSSGSAVVGALRYARDRKLGEDAVIVVLLPDTGARYLSKVFNDDWMREHGFDVGERIRGQVADILNRRPDRPAFTLPPSARVAEVVALMKAKDVSQLPVMNAEGELIGIVSERDVLDYMLKGESGGGDGATVGAIMTNRVAVVEPSTTLGVLARIFNQGDVAVVRENGHVQSVLTKIDLIDHLTYQLR